MVKSLEELLELAKKKEKKTMAVAVAQDSVVLEAVIKAVDMGIINAILVGNEDAIKTIAKDSNIDLSRVRIINECDINKAAAKAVELVTKGQANYVMKGLLGTSDLLKAVLNKEANLRTNNLLSHVMVYDVKSYDKLLLLTDGGMVPYPELKDKIGIIKNAVTVAKALEIDMPKVAPICAVEVVNPSMPATLDAANLSKMNERGQIKGCIIDGPLALDNALSKEAAAHKKISGPVAGEADILLMANIEAGNAVYKCLTYTTESKNGGLLMGAAAPVIVTSRADSPETKMNSIALASLVAGR